MPSLRAANVVILLLGAALFAMWFFLSLFLQQVLGHSPLETGLDFLPMTLSIVAAATLAPRLVDRFGAEGGADGRACSLPLRASRSSANWTPAPAMCRSCSSAGSSPRSAWGPRWSRRPSPPSGRSSPRDGARLGHGQYVAAGGRRPRPRGALDHRDVARQHPDRGRRRRAHRSDRRLLAGAAPGLRAVPSRGARRGADAAAPPARSGRGAAVAEPS